ncbi:hypothetical protein TNCV_2653791 [Trichonephila clavipes]|nr:hypothetical protein TNCV_2653791 [Trichonephila clavipes]
MLDHPILLQSGMNGTSLDGNDSILHNRNETTLHRSTKRNRHAIPSHKRISEMNQTCFQNVEEWSETNITGNNSLQWYFLTWSQVKWADIENYVEFLSKEMPDIKINDNCLFEVERRLNVYLNSNKLEKLENKHAEKLVEDG